MNLKAHIAQYENNSQLYARFGQGRRQQSHPVDSLADASAKWNLFRDEMEKQGFGSRDLPLATIVRADGKTVAYISYNGRVWSKKPGADDNQLLQESTSRLRTPEERIAILKKIEAETGIQIL